MISLSKAFSLRVKKILKDKKMSQYKLEQLTGICHSSMSAILGCKYKSVNFLNMAIIIKELGMSLSEFFDDPLFSEENLDI